MRAVHHARPSPQYLAPLSLPRDMDALLPFLAELPARSLFKLRAGHDAPSLCNVHQWCASILARSTPVGRGRPMVQVLPPPQQPPLATSRHPPYVEIPIMATEELAREPVAVYVTEGLPPKSNYRVQCTHNTLECHFGRPFGRHGGK